MKHPYGWFSFPHIPEYSTSVWKLNIFPKEVTRATICRDYYLQRPTQREVESELRDTEPWHPAMFRKAFQHCRFQTQPFPCSFSYHLRPNANLCFQGTSTWRRHLPNIPLNTPEPRILSLHSSSLYFPKISSIAAAVYNKLQTHSCPRSGKPIIQSTTHTQPWNLQFKKNTMPPFKRVSNKRK